MKLSIAIREFLEDCELAKGLAPKTITNYQHYLNRLLEFAGDIDVAQLTDKIVRQWRLNLNSSGKLSLTSQNYHLVALRALLAWLVARDIPSLPPKKIDLPGVEQPDVVFLNQQSIEKLLAAPDASTLKGKRDRAILETLFSTGLRVSELISLNRKQFNDSDELSIKGKGGKRRVVFISSRARQAVETYLGARHDTNDALFVPLRIKEDADNRLTQRSIQRIISETSRTAGLDDEITPHTLRHTFATDLLQAGADLRSVQALLGHSSVVTTQRYTHLTDTHLKEVHSAFHGRQQSDS
ncbi:tyrosine-type recombinase/integrase [Candidatus Berkelbacteria bacterium]|nr:tyrosine-type recombinase/integrase [Candidatus Berkelbacteria bacterium]